LEKKGGWYARGDGRKGEKEEIRHFPRCRSENEDVKGVAEFEGKKKGGYFGGGGVVYHIQEEKKDKPFPKKSQREGGQTR